MKVDMPLNKPILKPLLVSLLGVSPGSKLFNTFEQPTCNNMKYSACYIVLHSFYLYFFLLFHSSLLDGCCMPSKGALPTVTAHHPFC